MIQSHLDYILDPKGKERPATRLDLTGADLAEIDLSCRNLSNIDFTKAHIVNSDLSESLLRYSDFSRANLANSNLFGCDVRFANFRRTVLANAKLRGCRSMTSIGLIFVNMIDTRGHVPYLQVWDNKLYFGSGCRFFTIPEARAYWDRMTYNGFDHIADRYQAGLDWVESSDEVKTFFAIEMSAK